MPAQPPDPSPKPPAEGAAYGDDYLTWKHWAKQAFGQCKRSDAGYFAAEIKRAMGALPAQARVLEIGFGNGSFLAFCRSRQWQVCGTEVNSGLVDVARDSGFEALHTSTLEPLAAGSFDLVVAFDVLEHIPQDAMLAFLEQVKRVLRPGGVFIARFPNGDSPLSRVNQHGDVTHVTTIGSGKCRYFCDRLGVTLLHLGGQALPVLGTDARHALHALVARPIWAAMDGFINTVFFPGGRLSFASPNLILAFKTGAKAAQ